MREPAPRPDWNPTDDDVPADPPAACDALREPCPVAYSERMGWSVFRHADVDRAVNNHRSFSNAVSTENNP